MAMGLHPASSSVEYCPDHHLQSVQLLLRAAFTLSAVGRAECSRSPEPISQTSSCLARNFEPCGPLRQICQHL